MSTAVHITLDEFLARPEREDDQREELIEGELIVAPGAKVPHADIVRALRRRLDSLEQQGYVLSNDFSCILGDRSMPIPDLAAIQERRWQKAIADDNWLIGSPELVIEVWSPSHRKLDRQSDIYLDHGAEQVWIVYPKTQTVGVVTSEGLIEARLGETLELYGVQVPVDSIFLRPARPACDIRIRARSILKTQLARTNPVSANKTDRTHR